MSLAISQLRPGVDLSGNIEIFSDVLDIPENVSQCYISFDRYGQPLFLVVRESKLSKLFNSRD